MFFPKLLKHRRGADPGGLSLPDPVIGMLEKVVLEKVGHSQVETAIV
jgi:hypothetical protein